MVVVRRGARSYPASMSCDDKMLWALMLRDKMAYVAQPLRQGQLNIRTREGVLAHAPRDLRVVPWSLLVAV